MAFTSDDDGNLLTKTDLATSVVTEYKWTDHNRLASIETKLAGVSTGDIKQSNTFGVNGFRRKKKDKDDIETTEYAAGLATAVSKAQGGDTITYLMGHRLMGFERESDGAMFWFITDSLSSVRDVVRGTDGAVMASYEFSEYGQRISTSENGGVSSQKTFVGGRSVQDEVADTGLMMMGHRFYDPSGPAGGTGRFLNRDPIGFRGGLNLFEYGRSSPLQFTDPRGLDGGSGLQDLSFSEVTNEEFQGGVEFALGFNPVIGLGLSAREFSEDPSLWNFTMLGLSSLGLRSAINTLRGARAMSTGYGLRRVGERGAFHLGGGTGACTSLGDLRRLLSSGATNVFAASRQLAEELLFADYFERGIHNVTDWHPHEVNNIFGKDGFFYHWDEIFLVDEATGIRYIKDHPLADPHGRVPHLQIHEDGTRVRVFYPEPKP
jgi:RHS repeat-associated protein